MDAGQRLQPLDLQFGVAQRGGDGAGVHLGLPQTADRDDDIGDMHRGMLRVRKNDGGSLLRLGFGQLAVHQIIVVDVAAFLQEQQGHAPAPAVEGHVGLFALATGTHDRGDHHAGGEDRLGELRHAVVGGLAITQVLLRQPQVAEADLDADHRLGRRGGLGFSLDVGHRDQAPAPGRGSSCP